MTAELRRLPLAETIALALVVGLVVGSFVNVVIYRAPRGLSVSRPRSFCPNCGTALRSIDNIPLVSWMVLGGKCRTCRTPISPRYPLVEALVGASFALLGLAVGSRWALPGLCALAAGVIAMAAIELDDAGGAPAVPAMTTLIGSALLVAAAGASGLWAHLTGAAVGLAVAAALGTLAQRAPGIGTSPWDLLPMGVFLGWSGPVAGPAGLGALVLVALALRPVVSSGSKRALVAVPGAAACAVAVVVAVSVGAHLGA